MTKGEKTKITNALMKNETEKIKKMFQNYSNALDDIRVEMSKIAEKYAVKGKLTYAEMAKYNRLSNLEKNIFSELKNVYNKNKALTERLMYEQYGESFYRHYFSLTRNAGMDIEFGLLSPEKIKAAIDNPLEKISQNGLKSNGLNSIRRTITQDLIKGSSVTDMMNDIKDFIEADKNRLLTIVRTESQRAQVLGSQACYEDLLRRGVNLVIKWLATLDANTRKEHQDLDGVERKDKGWFVPSIGWVAGPLQSGVAAFDINCRCDELPEIIGFPNKYRRIKDTGITENISYETYAKQRGIK